MRFDETLRLLPRVMGSQENFRRNLLNFEFVPADSEPMNDWMGEAMNKRDWQFFIGGLVVVGILLGVILTALL